MDLTKIISALIVALIVATGQMPNNTQMKALYQCGYWDGSKIEVAGYTIEVKDGFLYDSKAKSYGEIADNTAVAVDLNIYNVYPICSGETKGEKGLWYYCLLKGEDSNGEICFDVAGEARMAHFVTAPAVCEKVGEDIVVTNRDSGKTIMKIKISTGKATRY